MNGLIDITVPRDQLEGTTATFTTWLVSLGDNIVPGQPLAELETDKVVMEVCAQASGIVTELSAIAGDEVVPELSLGKIQVGATLPTDKLTLPSAAPEHSKLLPEKALQAHQENGHRLISPAVKHLLKQYDLDLHRIQGSGRGGRVTRRDVLDFIGQPIEPTLEATKTASTFGDVSEPRLSAIHGHMVPHTARRQSIAKHMVESLLHISPHVTSVFEMDLSKVIAHREQHKKEFELRKIRLTLTAYFLKAMALSISAVPHVNARFHEHALEVFEQVNIGVSTALGDSGLVVPVIENVQNMSLAEIAQSLGDITKKARAGKLSMRDMHNGTITISNHGVSGSLFAAPIIINQPQVAILGVGKLEKRVVVREANGSDTMVIKPMCYVTLSIDHRALDAYQTNLFLSHFVNTIETWGDQVMLP